jgi:hypothetical protein
MTTPWAKNGKQSPRRPPETSFIAGRCHRPANCVQLDLRRRVAFLKDGQKQRVFVTGGNATTALRGGAITKYVKEDLGDFMQVIE